MSHLELEISNLCNEKCIHCYRQALNKKREFLLVNQAKSALEQAKDLGADKVTISGGEALLNPEWKKIIKIANDLGFKITLLTNGTLLKETDADFLANIPQLQRVQISLYSIDAVVHDSITRQQGSCNKTLSAIHLLQERRISCTVVCPVMKENLYSLLDTLLWCERNNILVSTGMFIFGTSDYSRKNLSHRLTKSDIKKLAELTMHDNGHFEYIWGTSHKRDLSQLLFYEGATSSLCISGDGTIYPTIGWYEPLGNIKTDSLLEVFYKNSLLKRIRNYKVSDFNECRQCINSDFCTFCCFSHITANHGELGKIDREWCDFIALRKQIVLDWRETKLKELEK